jgi:hypothetical protein
MAKFRVQLKETVTYIVEVEAEDGHEAQEIAAETWAQSEDPTGDFQGNGQGVEPMWWEALDPLTGEPLPDGWDVEGDTLIVPNQTLRAGVPPGLDDYIRGHTALAAQFPRIRTAAGKLLKGKMSDLGGPHHD